jgi:hypothetical protein
VPLAIGFDKRAHLRLPALHCRHLGSWQRIGSWIHYVLVAIAIAAIGFLAHFWTEAQDQASIVNNYAVIRVPAHQLRIRLLAVCGAFCAPNPAVASNGPPRRPRLSGGGRHRVRRSAWHVARCDYGDAIRPSARVLDCDDASLDAHGLVQH